MKLLKEISDASLGSGLPEQLHHSYELRKSARAILKKADNTIAVQHLQKRHYHKLPGGGVDQGESIEEALKREVQEEVGCECTIDTHLGVIIEYRNEQNLLHISYGFAATVQGNVFEPALEQAEIDQGMITKWISPHEALLQMKKDVPDEYQGPFILEREKAFLEEYTRLYSK